MTDRPTCLYVGCDRPATTKVQPLYGRPWFMCGKHAPDAAKALSIGGTGDSSATTTKLRT